jgi:hypothetical protein
MASKITPVLFPGKGSVPDERAAIDLVNFLDRANFWVVQGGRGLGFPLETAESCRVVAEFFGQELQSDVTT